MKRRVGTDGSLLPTLPWTLAAVAFALLQNVSPRHRELCPCVLA